MKTPRLSAFDPDAKVPSLKSSMDNRPSIQKPSINAGTTIATHHSEPQPTTKAVTHNLSNNLTSDHM